MSDTTCTKPKPQGPLNQPDVQFAAIEGQVVGSAALLLLLFVLDSFRRRSNNAGLRYLLLVLDTVVFLLVSYTVGQMDNSECYSELFMVWTVLLVTTRSSVESVSGYGVEDREEQRVVLLKEWAKSVSVAYFVAANRTVHFVVPLWLLWAFLHCKTLYRMRALERARRSYGVGMNNTKLVADYMEYEHELSRQDEVDPITMTGYKYLVMGEEKQEVRARFPGYHADLIITNEDKFITVEKVWQCRGRLLSPLGDPNDHLKDVCLSFALYKLLRRRFDGRLPLAESSLPKTRALILDGLLSNYERAFRVIELELAFLTDYFNTTYPVVFSAEYFPVFNSVVFVVTLTSFALAGRHLFRYHRPEDEKNNHIGGVNIDVIITAVVLVAFTLKELWEITGNVFSEWAKVVLLCKYVEKPGWRESATVERVVGFLCRRRLVKLWWGKLGQYSLLDSFDYDSWNLCHKLTLGLANETRPGARKGRPVVVSKEVKEAIAGSLRASGGRLTNGVSSLRRNNAGVEVAWACQLETHTHSILVWHVATTLCEVGCDAAWPDRTVASAISRYCAYLVVFRPSLLPDQTHVADFIFEDVIKVARDLLKGEESKEKMMMGIGRHGGTETIVAKGGRLGRQLMEGIADERVRWKVLADYWAEMLLYVAPSDDAQLHGERLPRGGEFITHVWALLSHAGIVEPNSATSHSV